MSRLSIIYCFFYFIALLINPILSLVYSIFLLNVRRHYSLMLFAVSMAVLIFFLVPIKEYDLYRWYLIFEAIKIGGIDALLNYIAYKPDYVMYVYSYALSFLGVGPSYLQLTVVFFGYAFYLSLAHRYIGSIEHKKIYYILLFSFIAAFDFRMVALGVRQGVAICIALYAVDNLFKMKKISANLMFFLACMIHFMVFPLIIIAYSSFWFKRVNIKLLLVFSLIFAFFPVGNAVVSLFSIWLPSSIINAYTDGYWANEYMQSLSLKGTVQVALSLIPVFAIWLLLFLNAPSSKWSRFSTFILLFVSLVSFSDTLLLRYSVVATMCLPIIGFLSYEQSHAKNKSILFVIFIISLLNMSSVIFSSRIFLSEIFSYSLTNTTFQMMLEKPDIERRVLSGH